jgi:hypothetical protein
MSEETDYKRQIWILENENKNLKQQLERMEGRLQEYLTWSEQAQKILEENKVRIAQLESERANLSTKVNQGTVAMSNTLLDENSNLKRKIQDFEEQEKEKNELMNSLVMNNIDKLDSRIKNRIKVLFSKSDNEKKILSLFIENPTAPITFTKILSETHISQNDCTSILKKLIISDFIRETSNGTYQTLVAIGDKVVSNKDLSRVSTEALHNYIIDQISSTIDSNQHAVYLEDYSNELKKRGENSLSRKIISLKGDLHMSKRPSEWIISQIEQAIQKEGNIPMTARQTQQTGNASTARLYTSSYTTPEISSRAQFQNPVKQQTTQLLSIDTSEWTKLSNADVIDNIKLQVSDKMDYLAVIEGLNALRDHLSSSVSGRALYQINNLINNIKNKKSFEKNEIHETLVDIMTKM